MLSVAYFRDLLSASSRRKESKLHGWYSPTDLSTNTICDFVEPGINIVEGDYTTAKAYIIAAPGAVGKSTYAKYLSNQTGAVVADLAQTDILGGNFFVGGLVNAFDIDGLVDFSSGALPLIVDALDEAQLRSGPDGYEDGLHDLAKLLGNEQSKPVVLFGRSGAAFDAHYILQTCGIPTCFAELEYFNEEQAETYLRKRLSAVAARNAQSKAAYERHAARFEELALETRERLKKTPNGGEPRFSGYAPVLDAVVAYAIEENLNPAATSSNLSATGPIQLVSKIADAVLLREQSKLTQQFLREFGESTSDLHNLYTPSEQLARLAALIMDYPPPSTPPFEDPDIRQAYERMVDDFLPQHPFLDGRKKPANAAFAASIFNSALRSPSSRNQARAALQGSNRYLSGVLFELFVTDITSNGSEREFAAATIELEDVGILFQSLSAQASQDSYAILEVTGDEDSDSVEVTFDLQHRIDDDQASKSFGPFVATKTGTLFLRNRVSNVNVSASISVSIGDGSTITCAAPVNIDAELLDFNGRELKVFPSISRKSEENENDRAVIIFAREALHSSVEKIVTAKNSELSVCFPGASSHPWTPYHVDRPSPPNAHVETLRRRARRVLTAFRSHSKGALVRLAAKIDHARMMKRDSLGRELVEKLLNDGILTTFNSGKFYVLHPDKLAQQLKMDYQSIQKQQWTKESDSYLEEIK